MKREISQQSFYYHDDGDVFDHWSAHYQNSPSSLSEVLKLIKQNHRELLDKVDISAKVDHLQKKLEELINCRFNQLAKMLTGLEIRINGQKAQEENNEEKSPFRIGQPHEYHPSAIFNRFTHENQDEQTEKDFSNIINIYDYSAEPDAEENSEMINLDKEDRDLIQWDEDEMSQMLNDPAQLLQHLSTTFQQMNLNFVKADKLYEFPKMQKYNFHSKIDRRSNILFLAELENNEIVGAFTHLCLDPQPNYIPKENSKSFLCNLTKKAFAFASRVYKTQSYDENYLIFGNWQIKVKWGSDVLTTNWGTNGDCFRLRRYGGSQLLTLNVEQFFGEGAFRKQLLMKRYVIYAFS